ncbi:hypothetical protein JYU34_006322 [Plutella xylostella]|uniref:Pyruvate kinase n=1 Tax=Plutella xylostella TaxID=51655 RepID=A0ABQ7QRX5_PLUXY|nr:hypothetical protein JYU34_006322 [Plutella xylostella]
MVWPTSYDRKLSEYDAMELPGQQLEAALADSPLDHLLRLDIAAPPACQRLSGICATIGPSSNNQTTIEQMIAAGMNVAILNMDFETRQYHAETIKMIRQAANEIGNKMGIACPVGIAARLTGRNIRTGNIANVYGDTVELKTGETVRLTSDETYKDRCSEHTIFADFINLGAFLHKGDTVLIDNETICLKVVVVSNTTITCSVEKGGLLGSNKDVFFPRVVFNIPNFTDKDKLDINMLLQHQVDILILPFLQSADAVLELREIMGEKGRKINIVAKIQDINAFNNFNSILDVINGVIISRQELGSDIAPEKLVIAQKNMIVRANLANIPVMVSAQLLSSMRFNHKPLRAELLDVANCILDGCDALVLSAETAIGKYPVETVACLAEICKEAEAIVWNKQIFKDMVDKTPLPCDHITAIALATVLAAQRGVAAAIIVVTSSGHSAQLVSMFRPRCPILAVTRYPHVARSLHMWRGVIPVIFEDEPDPDWQIDITRRVNFAVKWGMERGFVRTGDPLVLAYGWRRGAAQTNTMRMTYATPDNTVSV